ncbi:hypothetical protein LTR97_004575 [Elasticomyces elasticus]|uniref:Uncharacterized protein n=1 Tax=Elasticomyces elasticus TaxID=574655 RepID=A0AAN8A3E6_9PEZI|nr:hypothetical protein LTR97_004575 [Elasticomyces elasticus]
MDSILQQQLNESLTIWPDYHPQLLPPETMLPMISSIWATNHDQCSINPLGVWDPPVALQEQASVDGPSGPSYETTTAVVDSPSSETPTAVPVQYSTSPASATGAPEITNMATSDSDLGPSATAVASQSVQGPAGAIASMLAIGTSTDSQQNADPLQASAMGQSGDSSTAQSSSDPEASSDAIPSSASASTSATLTDLPTISPAASRSLGTTQIDWHTFIFTTNAEGSYTFIDPTTLRDSSQTLSQGVTTLSDGSTTAASLPASGSSAASSSVQIQSTNAASSRSWSTGSPSKSPFASWSPISFVIKTITSRHPPRLSKL